MKSTGITRPVDALGRVVIPMEIREAFGIKPKDTLDIFVENDKILLQKHTISCVFCNSEADLINFEDKKLCKSCLAKLTSFKEN